jgi:hypothetical protein
VRSREGLSPLDSKTRSERSPTATLSGPKMVLVRLHPDADRSVALASLRRIAAAAVPLFAAVPDGGGGGDSVAVLGVQYPAEIENYRTLGSTPAVLAGGLALGAILGLGLTLVASVRRRRHDLALLKTLGLTGRQLASVVAWQATVVVLLGLVVGVPVGIALGRWLWLLFATEIYAVPKSGSSRSLARLRRTCGTRARERDRGTSGQTRGAHTDRARHYEPSEMSRSKDRSCTSGRRRWRSPIGNGPSGPRTHKKSVEVDTVVPAPACRQVGAPLDTTNVSPN